MGLTVGDSVLVRCGVQVGVLETVRLRVAVKVGTLQVQVMVAVAQVVGVRDIVLLGGGGLQV